MLNLSGDLYDKNLYAYCDNNPVIRRDETGAIWETVFDIISLGASITEVVTNPKDPWAWAGLVGDAIDLIPVVTCAGEAIRGLKVVNKAVDTSATVKKGWKLGDDITNLTKVGNTPSWNTVRSRYWKNEAYYRASNYTSSNVARMKNGRAPLVKYTNGEYYSMELHHIISRRNGGTNNYNNLIAVTPWEHAKIDPYR